MAEFTPGLELARSYYREVVRPLIDARWPGLAHSAALLGQGSEVLGFDTERSTDHDWGPRLQLFVDADGSRDGVASALWAALPATYRGLPTRFESRRPPLVVSTPGLFFEELLGFDPRGGIGPHDWLGVSWQRLGEATAGAVFHDGLGELEPIRSALRWYPEDLWRYVLACQWQRIGQEEAFVGRCAEVGDALGSAVVTARLVRDVMHLWLLMARRYPPYSKWLGTAFARLAGAGEIGVALADALAAHDHPSRERALCRAYGLAAEWHNRLGLTAPLDPAVRRFHDRPFLVLDAGRFTTALLDSITDPAVRALPPVGAVDQYVDSTDVLSHTARTRDVAIGRESTMDNQPAEVWVVWRQDDNGNRFEVARLPTRAEAQRLADEMEARGHRQLYWVAELRRP
jgi:hypothetical protein